MKMHMTKILAAVLLGGTTLTSGAFAQDATAEGDQVKAVYDRYRPDYDAPGIRSGSFLLFPAVEAGGKYNSNIYAQQDNTTDDFIAIVKPSFDLVSDWNSDFFSLSAKGAIGRYADNSGEDYEDYGVSANGRKDISHGVDVHTAFSYDRKHEDRGSADVPGSAAETTKYSIMQASLGFKRDVSIMSLALDGSFSRRNYDDSAKVGGGVINNDDRDRDRYKLVARAGYELSDGYEAFIRLVGDRVKYDNSKEDGGPQRNSNGYQIEGGAAFDLTGKAKGEFFAGYMKRDYDSNSMGSIDGIDFGASLLWNMTGLTSLRGTVLRSIDETTISGINVDATDLTSCIDMGNRCDANPTMAGIQPLNINASGIVSSMVSLRAEHELRRNLLLSAEGSYTRQDFKRITRADDLYKASFGVRYLVTRNLRVNAGYTFDHRSSSAVNSNYDRHAFMVGVTGQW